MKYSKIFIIVLALAIAIVLAIALYMKFYGKVLIEDKLSEILGRPLKFESISFSLDKGTVDFKGFTIPDTMDFENKTLLNAELCSIAFDKEKFEKEKKLFIKEILIQKAVLNVERNYKGRFNIANFVQNKSKMKLLNLDPSRLAYAGESGFSSASSIYNSLKSIKKITIKDSIVNFRDNYLAKGTDLLICKNVASEISNTLGSDDIIQTVYSLNFNIIEEPEDGDVLVNGNAAIHNDRVDTECTITTGNIDLMKFLPYFENKIPFLVHEARFGSDTKIAMHSGNIDSLTTMTFNKLELDIKEGMEGTTFLQVAVDKLKPYLMSGRGEVIFDFVIKGPVEKPSINIGPKVKYAIGFAVMDEIINQLQKMQQ